MCKSSYLELTKTYRSSKEIIEYTNKILNLTFVSAIRKDNNKPVLFRKETNLKKVGAFLGDYAEIGCNSVLNPGTIIGKNTQIYPVNSVRGIIHENCIYKNSKNIVKKENL